MKIKYQQTYVHNTVSVTDSDTGWVRAMCDTLQVRDLTLWLLLGDRV